MKMYAYAVAHNVTAVVMVILTIAILKVDLLKERKTVRQNAFLITHRMRSSVSSI